MAHDTKLVFVDLLESLDQRGYDINENMPHFELSTQPGIMSEDERQIVVATLKKKCARLPFRVERNTRWKEARSKPGGECVNPMTWLHH